MEPTLASIISRRLDGGGGLVKIFSFLRGAEIGGSVSMVIFCGGGDAVGGFWNSLIRLVMLRMLPKQSVITWFHTEPVGRSMSEKIAFRRSSKR